MSPLAKIMSNQLISYLPTMHLINKDTRLSDWGLSDLVIP